MSGLVKAKTYDWKDSNIALVGTDFDRNVKKESAKTEPAWKDAGKKVGLQIWRIVKFKVTEWPKEDYGKFYNGDSYIILKTYKKPDNDALYYDVHFWIGKYSTQDEYGTAAYKTVELDTLLDDRPVQHREVENHESALFKTYFPNMETWEGGADTGFRSVEPEKYKPRMFHVHGNRKNRIIKEVPLCQKSLTKEDVFVVDCGLEIYQWNGVNANMMEKYAAGQYIVHLRSVRGGKPSLEVLDDQTDEVIADELIDTFADGADFDNDSPCVEDDEPPENVLIKLSDAGGELEYKEIARGKGVNSRKTQLKSEDVFILDTGRHCFVWIGRNSSPVEKKNGLSYSHMYLNTTKHPLVSVSCFNEGSEPNDFLDAFK